MRWFVLNVILLSLVAFTVSQGLGPQIVVGTAKEGIENAGAVLDLYNNVLDRIVPWKEFEVTITELDKYRNDYSKESADVLGEIKTHMKNGMNAYFRSTKRVYEWSVLAENLLTLYINLFDKPDEMKSKEQKSLLLEVLDEGVKKMIAAQRQLDKSSRSFNRAAGKLTSLNQRLAAEFDSKSNYYAEKAADLRLKGYGGAAVFGIIGLGIAYFVLEKNVIRELNEKLEMIKKFYDEMHEKVSKAFIDIEKTKDELKYEIREIGDIKIQTEETRTYVIIDKDLQSFAINSAKNLIDKCHEFRKRHSNLI